MRYRLKCLLSLMLLGIVTITCAAVKPSNIALYMQPSVKSRVVATLPYYTRFVPIYESGDWLKVGDPANGMVGWINKDEYMRALDDAVHSQTQTFVFESRDQLGKPPVVLAERNGKPLSKGEMKKYSDNIVVQYSQKPGEKQPEIIAYENGKKLSPAQSKTLLDRINVERAAMQQHFDQVQQNIQKMFQRSLEDFQQAEDDLALPSKPAVIPLEPGPVESAGSSVKPVHSAQAAAKPSILPNPFHGAS